MAKTRVYEVEVGADASNKKDRLCDELARQITLAGDRLRAGWYEVTVESVTPRKKDFRKGRK